MMITRISCESAQHCQQLAEGMHGSLLAGNAALVGLVVLLAVGIALRNVHAKSSQ